MVPGGSRSMAAVSLIQHFQLHSYEALGLVLGAFNFGYLNLSRNNTAEETSSRWFCDLAKATQLERGGTGPRV